MKILVAFWLLACAPIFAQQVYDEASVVAFQKERNAEFGDSLKSPLLETDRAAFRSLDFYPPNPEFAVKAQLIRTDNEKAFAMKTTTDRLPMYRKYGELHFMLAGKPQKLVVYQNVNLSKKPGFENALFLPFSDRTNGKTTYIGGRYIDAQIPEGDSMIVDFNKAYNPYCAYNYKYSCPIVPMENDLDIAIEAGTKKFHD